MGRSRSLIGRRFIAFHSVVFKEAEPSNAQSILRLCSVAADKRSTLLVERDAATAVANLEANADGSLDDPDEREDGEG